jgi:hypothetical protein
MKSYLNRSIRYFLKIRVTDLPFKMVYNSLFYNRFAPTKRSFPLTSYSDNFREKYKNQPVHPYVKETV